MPLPQVESYTQELKKHFAMLPAWPPTQEISVGDIGYLEDDIRFIRTSSLKQKDLTFKDRSIPHEGSIEYCSRNVSLIRGGAQAVAGVANLPGLELGRSEVTINLSEANSIVFHADGCKTKAIIDVMELENFLMEWFKETRSKKLKGDEAWDWKLSVVTEVTTCESLFVLISDNSNASLRLSSQNQIPGSLNLAQLGGNFEIELSTGVNTKFISKGKATPLFKAIRLKDPMYGAGIDYMHVS